MFHLPSSDWISLHALTIWVHEFQELEEGQASQAFDALKSMKSLRRLDLVVVGDHGHYEHSQRFGPISLTELHVRFDHTCTAHHANVISSYPNLTKLTLAMPPHQQWFIPLDHHQISIFSALLDFTFITYRCNSLNFFSTSTLARLDIQVIHPSSRTTDPEYEILHEFLLRCTDSLKSITLSSHLKESFLTSVLPKLSVRTSLMQITLDIWPFTVETNAFVQDEENDWCPGLRNLIVSIGSSDMVELERMKALAAFLMHRDDLGKIRLDALTIHRYSGAMEFPYESFSGVQLGELRVMVPL
ncbi:hypothetical protein BKA70DRAFT_1464622 [Coprinopsis sp. MPI-PUGE-AT-0042]|nr:hypothetical protein BKA70DRAFT_1464622 [Coprinopsis sp. MPI-PUGE-AT-0042]